MLSTPDSSTQKNHAEDVICMQAASWQTPALCSQVHLGGERIAVLMCPLPERGPLVDGVLRVAQLVVLGEQAVVPPHGRQVVCAPARINV